MVTLMRSGRLRIGYFPNSNSLAAPADRRRFVYYARHRGLEFELADPGRDYDIVVLNQRADLGAWTDYGRGRAKIIYEANDSYIAVPMTDFRQAFRGTFKFLSGQTRKLQMNYRSAVVNMCKRADAVICTTSEQRSLISEHCRNTHVILDFQNEDVLACKTSYQSGNFLHVVWEGLASSGMPLQQLRDILKPAAGKRSIVMHFVTDLNYRKYSNRFWSVDVQKLVSRALQGVVSKVHVHEWSASTLASVCVSSDLALIPVNERDPLQLGKPENKLLLLWRMGIPVLTSDTPAYRRAMDAAKLQMSCRSLSEWRSRFEEFGSSASARERAGKAGLAVAQERYSTEEMMRRWDVVMESVL